MADPIVVSVEIAGAEYIQDFEVDPAEPLVKLLQRVAKEEKIPLRKKSGHPLVWTAEGPDMREDHAGEWTELTRTQPLSRISEIVVERYGARSPLFTIRFTIPGADEALNERREVEKREEIEAKMAQRAAERQAEKSALIGDAEDEFVLDYAAPAEEPPTLRPEPPTVAAGGAGMGAAAGVVGAVAVGAAVAGGAAIEGRIRRRGAGGAGGAGAGADGSGAGAGGRGGSGAGAGGKGARSGKAGASKAGAGKAGGRSGSGKGGKGRGGKSAGSAKGGKAGASGPFAGTPLENVPVWAVGAAVGGAVLMLGLLIMVFSGGKDPEPEPTPAPPPPAAVTDIEIATPPPPPPKPVVEEAPTPPPMEGFYSRNKMVSYQAKEVSAQLTSFTKTNVEIVYTANHPNGGLSHTLSLEGRFTIKISDGGGNMNGKAFTAGVTPGKGTRVTLRYDGSRLTVRVGGKRAGSWPISDPGGFPRWRFDLDPEVEITGLRASAQVEE